MVRSVEIDFHPLAQYNLKYAEQEYIAQERVAMFLAAAIYYNFHMGSIMRFLSNNYTAAYRNVPEIMNNIRGIVDKNTCDDIERIFTTGCPNKIAGHSSHKNFMDYKNYGNHKSVLKNPQLIKKALNKEDKLNHAMPFPCWIARLCPNLFLTPNGIIIKPGKMID